MPTKTKDSSQKSRGMVVLPYVQCLAERASGVFKKHNIAIAMKPHKLLRKLLIHRKNKINALDKTNCIYEIPCKNCDITYIGETGRKLITHLREHKKKAIKLEIKNKNFTSKHESNPFVNKVSRPSQTMLPKQSCY